MKAARRLKTPEELNNEEKEWLNHIYVLKWKAFYARIFRVDKENNIEDKSLKDKKDTFTNSNSL
jgi:hypothetical protein